MASVLIVDDTEIVRRALEKAVRRMGHEAATASDGDEALRLAATQRFDLALLDFRMPGTSGTELYAALRRALAERCPKVLFVSATPPDEVRRQAEPVGPVVGYVKKPFHLDDLVRMLARALEPGPAPQASGVGG